MGRKRKDGWWGKGRRGGWAHHSKAAGGSGTVRSFSSAKSAPSWESSSSRRLAATASKPRSSSQCSRLQAVRSSRGGREGPSGLAPARCEAGSGRQAGVAASVLQDAAQLRMPQLAAAQGKGRAATPLRGLRT